MRRARRADVERVTRRCAVRIRGGVRVEEHDLVELEALGLAHVGDVEAALPGEVLLADAAQFDPVERDFQGFFAAGAADAVLEAAGFRDASGEQRVEVVADREVVGDLDQVVELVRVFVDVVELLLPGRPGDVLVGPEADSLVVLRRSEDRRGGAAVAARARRGGA